MSCAFMETIVTEVGKLTKLYLYATIFVVRQVEYSNRTYGSKYLYVPGEEVEAHIFWSHRHWLRHGVPLLRWQHGNRGWHDLRDRAHPLAAFLTDPEDCNQAKKMIYPTTHPERR